MSKLKLVDVEVLILTGVSVTRLKPDECVARYRLEGTPVRAVREEIEAEAVRRGYHLDRTETITTLNRGAQRITLVEATPTTLSATADDPEQLPLARTTEEGIALGRLTIPIGKYRIVPGRERHDADSTVWIGEWDVHGIDAQAVSTRIVDALATRGLRSSGTFGPTGAGGGDTWHTDVFAPNLLVKILATDRDDSTWLRLEIVDDKGR